MQSNIQQISKTQKTKSASSIAVVAIGNTLRGDDGIAQALIAKLPPELASSLEIIDLGIKTQQINECTEDFAKIVIIDASAPAGSPGKVTIVDLVGKDIYSRNQLVSKTSSTHGLSVADEIAIHNLANKNNQKQIYLFAVEICNHEFGQLLSEELIEQLPKVRTQLLQFLTKLTISEQGISLLPSN